MTDNELKEGSKAPAFSLEGDDGKTYTLESFRGKTLILYFYPKDNTSGCTKEGIEFSAAVEEFGQKNAVIVGVSPDSIKSHQGFKTKQPISLLLLSDPERAVAATYGAYGEKKMYGKTTMGIIRSTFVINADGVVEKIYRNVKVNGHVDNVMCGLK